MHKNKNGLALACFMYSLGVANDVRNSIANNS